MSTESPFRLAWYGIVTLLAVFTYFYELDSQHIPNNGDEYPYEHIARLTANSGHLLPLQSQLTDMRNTKPPMLSWQGIASTDWGRNWTLWNLRYLSVIYTLLSGVMVFLLAWKLSSQLEAGFLALLTFLAFFSTYHYGRPYLINSPEVFWLFLPFFALLYWQPIAFASRFFVPLLLGVGIGIALLYKTFALIVPVGIVLAWWYLHHRQYRWAEFLVQDSWKIATTIIIALSMFGMWFLLDPDPHAVWKEFVVVENLGKFDPHGGSYLLKFLWGGSSVWSLALSYPFNAGLLAFPVAALFFVAYKRRNELVDAEKLLWIWIFILFVFFSLPSHRSGRNLLAAMPAAAVLCAINWGRISRKMFIISLVATGALLATLTYLSVRLEYEITEVRLYPLSYWMLLASAELLVLLALFVPKLTRPSVNATIILTYLSYAVFLHPFDGHLGSYAADVQQYARGKDVWVPCNFRAKDERYRFILPGANVHGYRNDNAENPTASELGTQYSRFAVWLPLKESLKDTDCVDCKIIGQRMEIRTRLISREYKDILRGNVIGHLFVKELLIEAPRNGKNSVLDSVKEGCR